jgi:hypothetical protein
VATMEVVTTEEEDTTEEEEVIITDTGDSSLFIPSLIVSPSLSLSILFFSTFVVILLPSPFRTPCS